jgi:hypothetical protein
MWPGIGPIGITWPGIGPIGIALACTEDKATTAENTTAEIFKMLERMNLGSLRPVTLGTQRKTSLKGVRKLQQKYRIREFSQIEAGCHRFCRIAESGHFSGDRE